MLPSDSTGGNEIESLLFAGDGIPPPCIENNSKTPSLELAGSVNHCSCLFGGSMLGRGCCLNIRIALSRLDSFMIVKMRKKLEKVPAHTEHVRQDWILVIIFPVDLELEDPTPTGRGYDA